MGKTHFPTPAGSGNEWVDSFYRPNAPMGNVFYVQSTNSRAGNTAGKGYNPEAPFSTIDYAVGKCAAGNNDVIIVLPGHVETVTAAAGLALDVAGVTVRGIGSRRYRPKVNFTTATAASCNVTAAGVVFENIWFNCAIDAQTALLNVQAADCVIRDCEISFADGTYQATGVILGNASANRFTLEDCVLRGTTDAGTAVAVDLVGGDDIIIRRNSIIGAFTTSIGGIRSATTDCLRILIEGNTIANQTASSTKAIVLSSGTTGSIINNRLHILSGTAPITAAAGYVGGNTYSAAAGVTAATAI